MSEVCNDKKTLFQKIHECEFMMIDLGLYLDTHPFISIRLYMKNMQLNTSASSVRSHSIRSIPTPAGHGSSYLGLGKWRRINNVDL